MRTHNSLLIAAALVALTPLAAHASLKGLTGLRIADPSVSADLSTEGVTKKIVRDEIKAYLNAANIPITKTNYPFFEIDISSIKSPLDVYSYTIDVRVYETVQRLNAAKTVEPAIIWADGNIGTADMDDLGPDMKTSIDSLLARFISSYAADNPTSGVMMSAPLPNSKLPKSDDAN